MAPRESNPSCGCKTIGALYFAQYCLSYRTSNGFLCGNFNFARARLSALQTLYSTFNVTTYTSKEKPLAQTIRSNSSFFTLNRPMEDELLPCLWMAYMTQPNFFLIGHPRSGTGTLDGYLLSHPDIFMAAKELHYFGSDLHFNSPKRSKKNYLAYFKGSTHTYTGESSTWYLASQQAASEIFHFAPDAKIILSLRNPVDWLYSLHSHMVFAGYEDTADFREALNKEDARLQGDQMPKNAHPPIGVCYRSLVRYTEQVERYFTAFGRDNVHVIIFDQLKREPTLVLDETLRFLGLPVEYEGKAAALQGSKKQRNANHAHRSKTLHHWIKSGRRRALLHGVIKAPFPGPRLILRLLHKLNTKTVARKQMDFNLRTQLTEEFKSEVEALESLLDVNLSSWKGNDPNTR